MVEAEVGFEINVKLSREGIPFEPFFQNFCCQLRCSSYSQIARIASQTKTIQRNKHHHRVHLITVTNLLNLVNIMVTDFPQQHPWSIHYTPGILLSTVCICDLLNFAISWGRHFNHPHFNDNCLSGLAQDHKMQTQAVLLPASVLSTTGLHAEGMLQPHNRPWLFKALLQRQVSGTQNQIVPKLKTKKINVSEVFSSQSSLCNNSPVKKFTTPFEFISPHPRLALLITD